LAAPVSARALRCHFAVAVLWQNRGFGPVVGRGAWTMKAEPPLKSTPAKRGPSSGHSSSHSTPRASASAAPQSSTESSAYPTAKAMLKHAWLDRDLGWLGFNERVLHEALDERTPLLERVKFLAIFSANLDEFAMKRLGSLRAGDTDDGEGDPLAQPDDAHAQLRRIRERVIALQQRQADCYTRTIVPELARHGVILARWAELSAEQRAEAGAYFDANVSPALTPLGLDPAHPFPFMSNLSTNLGFVVRNPDTGEVVSVRVKIPTVLPAWVALKPGEGAKYCFLGLDELIRESATKLFAGMEILGASLFRILRDAEVELEEEKGETVAEAVSDAVRERRFQPVVRIDFSSEPPPDADLRRALIERFSLREDDIYVPPGLLDYTTLFQIAGLDLPALRDPPFVPLVPARLPSEDTDVFAVIRAGDLLVHHPYESFDRSVEHFIAEAADDPATVAIKMTVYRVGDDTPFVRSLIRAAEAGKQVACVIELKARFDEERNLHWARALEKVGAHVVYGVLGLKTHTKLALVVRKEAAGLRSYAHIGTGNYHVKTARLYADLGLFTCDPLITGDAVNLFHYLTGAASAPRFNELLVAPSIMRDRFVALVEREVAHHLAGRPARIIAKMNQLEDVTLCRALVAASRAGVPIDLIVRGFCCLRPGVPGWTEHIRVRSVIGRFLEHSRVFYFANGSTEPTAGDYYIGSADWMYRNLSRRVEAATPIKQPALRARLWELLEILLQDERQAWVMQPDGSDVQLQPPAGAEGPAVTGTHAWLIDLARRRSAAA
jgi:polyphosphate kinase